MRKQLFKISSLLFITYMPLWASVIGTVTFEKRHYSVSSTDAQVDAYVPLIGAKVQLVQNSDILATTTTASDGTFGFNDSVSGSYSIVVYAANDHVEVGTSWTATSVSGQYTKTLTDATGNGPHSITISIAEGSGAFNIMNEIERGWQWFDQRGYTMSSEQVLRVRWPGSGSYFEPDDFTMSFLGVSQFNSDPDEFDDDVILHEFGHAAAEAFSIDHSLGGSHSINGHIDLRLAWSEGLATYIMSAIKGDTNYRDSSGSTQGGITNYSIDYDISQPSLLAKQSTNEWSVSYILYQAQSLSGADEVLSTLASFKTNSTKLDSEQATLDAFHDLWTGGDLASFYQNQQMSYLADAITNNSDFTTAPKITGDLDDLTFYPSSQSDFFKHLGSINDVLTIETSDPRNGVLTGIKLYRLNDSSLTLINSNNQKDGKTSDQVSKLVSTLSSTGTYIIEILRFNSSTSNYGLGSADGYEKTAGTYGTYDLKFSYVRTTPLPNVSLYDLEPSTSDDDINTTFNELLESYDSTDLTSRIKAFGNIISSAGQRDFSDLSNAGTSTLSVINSANTATAYTINDPTFPITLTGIPAGITAVVSVLPKSYETLLPDLSREKFFTIDLLDGSDLYTKSATLSIGFNTAKKSGFVHQLLKQNGNSFTIYDELLDNPNDSVLTTTITSTGVYSLRQLVNSSSTLADRELQLASFIDNHTTLSGLKSELAYFHFLVDNNGDKASFSYGDNMHVFVAKSSGVGQNYNYGFIKSGNVTLSNIDEDLVLVLTSLPKSLTSSSLPENNSNQLFCYNIVSTGVVVNSGFSDISTTFEDQGRSDFDYSLYKLTNNSFTFQSNISTTTPLEFDIDSDGYYLYSSIVNTVSSDALDYLVTELLKGTDSITELTSSSMIPQFFSLGNVMIATNFDNSLGTVVSLNTITSSNQIITHADNTFPISLTGFSAGNTLAIMTIPLSEENDTLPLGATGKIFSLNLYNNGTPVTTGFSLPITLTGKYNASVTQKLFVKQPDGTYSNDENDTFTLNSSGSDLTFTATHFTDFVLVETSAAAPSSGGGGGGGGCLLK